MALSGLAHLAVLAPDLGPLTTCGFSSFSLTTCCFSPVPRFIMVLPRVLLYFHLVIYRERAPWLCATVVCTCLSWGSLASPCNLCFSGPFFTRVVDSADLSTLTAQVLWLSQVHKIWCLELPPRWSLLSSPTWACNLARSLLLRLTLMSALVQGGLFSYYLYRTLELNDSRYNGHITVVSGNVMLW